MININWQAYPLLKSLLLHVIFHAKPSLCYSFHIGQPQIIHFCLVSNIISDNLSKELLEQVCYQAFGS